MGRAQTISLVVCVIQELLPVECRVLSLNNGVARVITSSAPAAAEIRLREIEILERLKAAGEDGVTKIAVSIRG